MLLWQGPTLLNPHFGTGTKDQLGSRVFYEPLAASTPTATACRSSPPRCRAGQNGGIAADGRSVTWKLKRGVTWHDGAPFTADDCRLQLAVRDRPGDGGVHARAPTTT